MGYVGKVTAGGSTHLVGSTLYGTCATAAATAAKVVTCADFTTLITGVTIHVKFTNANSAGSPTLNVNSTGAKSIYRYGTTTPSTSTSWSWYAGAVVSFTYDGSAWIMNDMIGNDNNYDRAVVNRAVKAAAAVTAGQIIVGTSAGYKPAASGVTFDISYPILWASTAIDSGATKTNTYAYYTAVDLTKTKSGYAGTTYSTVYLVCSSLDGNIATVHPEIFRTTQPTTADGLYYIPLGLMYSTTACYFYPINKVFRYVNGHFTEVMTETDSVYDPNTNTLIFGENLYEISDNSLRSSVRYYKRNNSGMLIIGDSWSVGGSASSTSKRYSTLLCNALGMTEYNYGVGGAGFNVTNNRFDTQVATANTNLTADQKESISVVLVCGLVNDLRHGCYSGGYTLSACSTAMLSCLNAIHTNFPNALIVLAIGNTLLDFCPDTWHHWISYLQIQAEKWSCTTGHPLLLVKNLGACVNGIGENYQSDYLHLTDEGHNRFAAHIANAIMGGTQNVFYYIGGFTYDSAVTTKTLEGHFFRDNDFIVCTSMNIGFSSTVSSNTLVGQLPNTFIAPKTNLYFPAYSSNVPVGSLAITNAGAIRFIPTSGNTPRVFYVPEFRWLFTGSASSPKT